MFGSDGLLQVGQKSLWQSLDALPTRDDHTASARVGDEACESSPGLTTMCPGSMTGYRESWPVRLWNALRRSVDATMPAMTSWTERLTVCQLDIVEHWSEMSSDDWTQLGGRRVYEQRWLRCSRMSRYVHCSCDNKFSAIVAPVFQTKKYKLMLCNKINV